MRLAAAFLALSIGTRAIANMPAITDNRDPGFAAFGAVTIVASLPAPNPSGIALIGGQTLLSFPKHDGDHAGPTLGEWTDRRILSIPSSAMALDSGRTPAERLVSVRVDGSTLSRYSSRLYYAPLSSHRLDSLPTALLADFLQDDAALASATVDEGEATSLTIASSTLCSANGPGCRTFITIRIFANRRSSSRVPISPPAP